MAKHYAWSNFPVEFNEHGRPTKIVEVGEEVSSTILAVDEDTYKGYVRRGLVREQPYPEISPLTSPAEYFRHLRFKGLEGRLTSREVKALNDAPPESEPPEASHAEIDMLSRALRPADE